MVLSLRRPNGVKQSPLVRCSSVGDRCVTSFLAMTGLYVDRRSTSASLRINSATKQSSGEVLESMRLPRAKKAALAMTMRVREKRQEEKLRNHRILNDNMNSLDTL